MERHEIPYTYLLDPTDGNPASFESRLEQVVALLQGGESVIVLTGTECRTEAELREAVAQKGGILC